MAPLNVMLVDDNAIFLQAAADYLAGSSHLEIVGTAGSGLEAVEKAENLRPDIIFMDISMPDMNGLEATRRIKRMPHPPLVVILTFNDSIDYRCDASAAGADAFLKKDQFVSEIFSIIHGLVEGNRCRLEALLNQHLCESQSAWGF